MIDDDPDADQAAASDPGSPSSRSRLLMSTRHLLVFPVGLLSRVRWLFALAAVLTALTQLPLIALSSGAHVSMRAAAVAAVVWLCWSRIDEYRRGRSALWTLPLEGLALLLIGLVAGPDQAQGLLFGGIFARAVYGTRRDVALAWTVYSAAALGIFVLGAHGESIAAVIGELFALTMLAALIHFLAIVLGQHERTVARERRLREAGTALVAQRGRERIYQIAADSARALAGTETARSMVAVGVPASLEIVATAGADLGLRGPLSLVDLMSRDATASAAAPWTLGGTSGTEAERLVIVPFHGAGRSQSVFVVASDAPYIEELRHGLEALGAQVALALDNAELTDDLYRRRHDARFRALVQNVTDIILIVGADGKLRYVSPSVETVVGYTPDELIDRDAFVLIHPEDAERARRKFAATVAAQGVATPIEFRIQHRDGSWRRLESIGNNQLDDPEIGGIVVNGRDITDRARTEQQLQLLQSITAAIAEAEDLDAALAVALQRVCETTGWSYGAAWLTSDDGTRLTLSPAWWPQDPDLDAFRTASAELIVVPDFGLPGRVYASGRPEWVQDIAAALPDRYPRAAVARQVHFSAAMGVPVLAGASVVAVLEFFLREPRDEDEELVAAVAAVAAQIGAFVQRKQAEAAVRQSEARFRQLFADVPQPMWVYDRETLAFLEVNDAAQSHYGYSRAEFLDMRIVDLHPSDDITALRSLLSDGQSATTRSTSWRHRRKDGSLIDVEMAARVVDFERRPAAQVVAQDVTVRKRAEELLRNRETQLRQAQEIAHLGSWTWDLATGALGWSEELCRIFGVRHEDAAPSYEAFLDLVHPEDRQRSIDEIRRAREEGLPFAFEHRIIRADGSVRTLQARGEFQVNAVGEPFQMTGIEQDITERREAEAALRGSEERYRSVVESASNAILSCDALGLITGWNRGAQVIFGYAADDVIGRPVRMLMPERYRDAHQQGMDRLVVTGEPRLLGQTLQLRGLRNDGLEFPIELSLGMWIDDGATFFSAVIRDVSEQEAAGEALRQSEERFRSLVSNASDMIVILDPDGSIRYQSPSVERVMAYPGDSLVGHGVFAYVHPEDVPLAHQSMTESIASGPGPKPPLELRFRHGDGSWRCVEIVANNLLDDPAVGGVVINARDVSEQKQSQEEIQRQANLLDQAYDAIFAWEMDGPIIFWNRGAERLYGYTREEALGRTSHELLRTRRPDAGDAFMAALERDGFWEGELEHRRRDGTHIIVETRHEVVHEGERRFVVEINRDISARKAAEAALRANETRFRALVQNASDIIAVVTLEGELTYVSPSVERVLGASPDQLVGRPGVDLIHPDDRVVVKQFFATVAAAAGMNETTEVRARHQNGEWRALELIANNQIDDPSVKGIVFNARDVTERKVFEEQLAHQAFHDTLTSLPNRALFLDRLEQSLMRTRRRGDQVGVLFLDLDGFKVVNDSLGHEAGDTLLAEAGARLRASVGASGTVARFGGDEFTVLLEELESVEQAFRAAQELSAALRPPVALGPREVFMTTSIGIAIGTADDDAHDLLRRADVALYAAKRGGRDRYELFRPSMTEQASLRLEVESDLRRAVERSELELHYQPVIAFPGEEVCGVEALVRWRHPQRGLVPPGEFIPLAEESGLIISIGRWVLLEACRQVASWTLDGGKPPLTVSVNVSARQFQRPDLVTDVERALHDSGLAPHRLTLELTERMLIGDTAMTAGTLARLRNLGVRVAIDDFGTDYSSLSYLRRLPVDELKIDREFVRDLGQLSSATSIVSAVVTLAHGLGLSVTAEGIETPDQLRQIRALRVDRGQGFYFTVPLPPGELLRWLAERAEDGPVDAAAPGPSLDGVAESAAASRAVDLVTRHD